MRVLIVDDYPDTADSCALLLQARGHEATIARSGEAALSLTRSFRPHLVLLDIGLADLDGREVCRRLRQEDCGTDAVIVTVTGWTKPEIRSSAFAAGCDWHLLKPVALAELQDAIAEAERRSQAGASRPTASLVATAHE